MTSLRFQKKFARLALRRLMASLVLITSVITLARAADFPSHVVTIVSPYQAGGTSDIIARLVAQKLSERWGQSVIVENQPGANGGIGVSDVAKAMPDGHTLLAVASSALTINPLFYKSLPYDVNRDLAPLTVTGRVANVLVVNPVSARDQCSAIDRSGACQARPAQLRVARRRIERPCHRRTVQATRRRRYPARALQGSTPAVQDLLGGQVQLMFDNMPTVLPMIRAGKLRALAVTTIERSPQLPDTPTLAESGLTGFDTSAWFALLTAKAVPAPVLSKIEHDTVAALHDPDARDRLNNAGIDVTADGSAALGRRITDETKMWRDVVSKAGIKLQ